VIFETPLHLRGYEIEVLTFIELVPLMCGVERIEIGNLEGEGE
jgi:hypothetical protein